MANGKMKAYVCKKYGPPENLQLCQCDIPAIKDNEVLINTYATSVTNSDIFIRSAMVSPSVLLPFRLAIGITGPRKKLLVRLLAV